MDVCVMLEVILNPCSTPTSTHCTDQTLQYFSSSLLQILVLERHLNCCTFEQFSFSELARITYSEKIKLIIQQQKVVTGALSLAKQFCLSHLDKSSYRQKIKQRKENPNYGHVFQASFLKYGDISTEKKRTLIP